MEILKGVAFVMTLIMIVDFIAQASQTNKMNQDPVSVAGMIKWKI